MKKIILSALALILVGAGCINVNAQEKTKEQLKAEAAAAKALKKEFDGYVKLAKKNSQIGEGFTPNIPAAREAIQNAAKLSLAEGNADFYLQAGAVESAAFQIAAQANDLPGYASSASAGFDYYKKAFASANGNKKVEAAAQQGALNLFQQTSGLAMIGNVFYQEKDFVKCLAAFRAAKTAANEPVLTSNPLAQALVEIYSADSTINNLSLNCFSVAQYMLNDTIEANKELIYLKEHAKDNEQLNQVMQALALNYYGKDDTLAFESTLKEGVEKLPNESWYINNLINVYINRNDLASASGFLDKGIEADPQNATLVNMKGQVLEQQGQIEEALVYYEKALSLDPSSVTANSSLGRYYFNRAAAIEDEYFNKRKFDEADRQAAPMYDKALPYYEAAYAFDTERKDKGIAIALRRLYGRQISKKGKTSAAGKELQVKYDEVTEAYGIKTE